MLHFRQLRSLLFFVLLATPYYIYAQIPRLYTTQHGLTTSDIRGIDIDGRGVAWISGSSTLEVFDGYGFYDISLKDKKNGGNISDIIYGVDEIAPMKYLVSTISGLFCYDLSSDVFTRIYLNDAEKSNKGYSIGGVENYPKTDCKLVFTEGAGVFVLNVRSLTVDEGETAKISSVLNAEFVFMSYVDSKNRLWISDMQNKIRAFDMSTMKQIHIDIEPDTQQKYSFAIFESVCESKGTLFFGARSGLFVYNDRDGGRSGSIGYIEESSALGAPVSCLIENKEHKVIVGTDSRGIWELSGITNGFSLVKYDMPATMFSLEFGKVKCMEMDSDGNLLIGLLQKGLMVMPSHSDTFRYHAISPDNDGLNATSITSIKVDKHLNYWIATDGCGVFRTDGLHLATAQPVNAGLKSLLVQSVVVDRNQNIWVGSYGGGVQCYHNGEFVTPEALSPLSDGMVMALAYDSVSNNLVIGLNGMGVYTYDIQTEKLQHIGTEIVPNPWITALFIDNDKGRTLYVGTTNGLFYMSPVTGSHDEIRYDSLNSSAVQCIDKIGDDILIGTNEALLTYNLKSGQRKTLIDGKRIMAIEQTAADCWVSVSDGIESIDKKTFKRTTYNSIGGFYLGEFHRGCSVHPVPDDILFGGDNGIICFTPSLVKQHVTMDKPIVFTQMQVGDEVLSAIPEEIRLPHDKNSFTLYFSVPNFSDPDRIRYQYILEGLESEWHTCKGHPEISCLSVPSGHYTLHVKAFDESDPDSFQETSVDVLISAPWYASFWAWLVYVSVLLFVAYHFYEAYKSRLRQREVIRQAIANEQMKEARLRMFTSITHELRTPLTMIVSPLNQLSSSYSDPVIRNLCNVMRRNCDRLLNIVKQITDIRHIDSGQMRLHCQEVDFIKYADGIFTTFKANSVLKNVSFIVENTENIINVWIDTVQFEKILVNLLSNAFKFTPNGGKIIVRTTVVSYECGKKLEVRVYNSGSHIDSKDIPNIFERFFQGSNSMKAEADGKRYEGSGIGLNLAHELITMHHGDISVHNVEPDGVEFVLHVPLGNSHLDEGDLYVPEDDVCETKADDLEVISADDLNAAEGQLTAVNDGIIADEVNESVDGVTENAQEEAEKNHQTVLVVDDDRELCEYISKELGRYYNTIVAFSGNSAWQVVLKQRPDVIVTDIRMSDGDGLELCKRVKTNPETDYIPVIMLTSENGEESQIRSLNLRVDHFLSKPFNLILLRGAIGQVISVRENLRQRINRKDMSNDFESISMDSADDKLFLRINEQLMKHLDESDFGVEKLADHVGISRVHLNRKMKEKYGVSPRQFIKSFKLKQAAYLLIHNNVNVSEVVYKLGFSSHSFFTSSFHDYFGMTPKEFVTKYADNLDDETLKKLLE